MANYLDSEMSNPEELQRLEGFLAAVIIVVAILGALVTLYSKNYPVSLAKQTGDPLPCIIGTKTMRSKEGFKAYLLRMVEKFQ